MCHAPYPVSPNVLQERHPNLEEGSEKPETNRPVEAQLG